MHLQGKPFFVIVGWVSAEEAETEAPMSFPVLYGDELRL